MTDLDPRIAALSPERRRLLEALRGRAPAAGVIPRVGDGPAPLSAEQRRLWYLVQVAPAHPIYTITAGFRLRGAVDEDALEDALRDLVARHETLRTALRESAGEPVQAVGDGAGFALERVDIRGHEWVEEEAAYRADAFARRTFAVARGETFRAALLRVADDERRLLVGAHHLAADGWSLSLLLRELSACYAARAAGAEPSLPPPALRFRDWAAWRAGPGAPPLERAEAFWRAELAGAPAALNLPPDRARPPAQTWDGAKVPFEIGPALTAGVRALARREGVTPYAVLAAAFALVLARRGGDDDVLVGTPLANRPRPELEGVVGLFAAVLPLRVRLADDPTGAALLRRVHLASLAVAEHAAMPFDRLVEIAGVRRDAGRPPLVQAVLAFMDAASSSLSFPGVESAPLHTDGGTSIFDLTVQVEDAGERMTGSVQYATQVYDEMTARGIARHLRSLLAALAADPALPVSRLALADEEEVRAARAWSDGGPPPALDDCIHTLFERQAAATPHAVAVATAAGETTYAELDARANRIAHALRARGVGPEARVGVCMRRTPALLAVLLGVMKAGGAYVPMDPAHPPARKAAVLRMAGAALVVADEETIAGVPATADGHAPVDAAALDGGRGDAPAPRAGPGSLAYVLFTSGSTGGPKGVLVEHRSVVATLAWVRDAMTDEERAGVLGSLNLTFDYAVAEVFGTLCWGGTLVLVENALAPVPPGRALRTVKTTPTAAAELLRAGRFPAGVTTVFLGGEAVPAGLVLRLHALPDVRRVVNVYGPTEDTVYSASAELEPGTERVPIGRPLPGGRCYVLDAALRHAGTGALGEIWMGGAGVARGYAGRPGLTAERFLPDPHGPPGSRMYRSLDLGRWTDEGMLEYLGRGDAQVKVRGHRIELQEVEEALSAHPAISACAAAVRGDGAGGPRLVAYVVPTAAGEAPAAGEMRAFLRERLPESMVPTAFVSVAELPRTASGKLDRRALPAPEAAAAPARAEPAPPRDETEARLLALWREVLETDRIGIHDDFFDLGGQSILALRLVARMRSEMGAEVAVATLLQSPTVAGLARAVAERDRAVRLPLVALQTFGERPPLFLAHPGGGHVVCYRALAVLLAMEQPVYALQPRGVEDGGRTPLETVEEMAAFYVEAIRARWPRGPYRLGGWSFGGLLAWEMARQLAAAGHEVDVLALLDTAAHDERVISYDPGDPADVVWHTVAGIAGYGAAARVDVASLRGLEGRAQALAMIRGVGLPQLVPESRVDDVMALTVVRAANLRAQTAYVARPYPGPLTYFRTSGSEDAEGRSPGAEFWGALALGGATVHDVGGTHGTILHEPYVQKVAAALLAAGARERVGAG
jgi:amino acid adenylation domain-containing protein